MSDPAATRDRTMYKRGRSLIEIIETYSMPVPECGCWIWLGASHRYGYVKLNGKVKRAHRVSWVAHNKADIPEGMQVLHKCDSPLCVNPEHLFLGTPSDNAIDREAKGRGNQPSGERNGQSTKPWRTARGERSYAHRHPEIRQGERNGRAKISEHQARMIRKDQRPSRIIGQEYGISKTVVLHIRIGKLWSHLQ